MELSQEMVNWQEFTGSRTISKYIACAVSKIMRACKVNELKLTFTDDNIAALIALASPKSIHDTYRARVLNAEPDLDSKTITFKRRTFEGNAKGEFEFDAIYNHLNSNIVGKIQRKSQCFTNPKES